MRLEIELWCIQMIAHDLVRRTHLSILGPKVDSACQQKPSHEVEGIVRRAPRQDCVGTDLGKGTKKMSATLNFPKITVASIKWKEFGTTKTLPRAGSLSKLSNRGRRAWHVTLAVGYYLLVNKKSCTVGRRSI